MIVLVEVPAAAAVRGCDDEFFEFQLQPRESVNGEQRAAIGLPTPPPPARTHLLTVLSQPFADILLSESALPHQQAATNARRYRLQSRYPPERVQHSSPGLTS
jgi:hypothetical protein